MPNEPMWSDELDALTAAPEHHLLMMENDSVRVLDTCVPPGQTVPLHTHRWPSVLYILSWSDFIRRDANGNILLDSKSIATPSRGSALWSPPLAPHTLENTGMSDLRAISVEIKIAASAGADSALLRPN